MVAANVLIVGAGLGGLAAAISIADAGHHVTVIESAAELAEVGAGVQITPQSLKAFRRWGIYDELAADAAEPISCEIRRYDGSKLLGEEPDWRGWMIKRHGEPLWDLHRADMQRAMWRKAEKLGVKFHFGCRVGSIDCSAATVTLKSGEVYRSDLVIAADGLHGMSRGCLLGRPDPPIPTGNLAYRIVLEKSHLTDPELLELVEAKPACRLWVGPNAHVVFYSLKAGRQANIVLLCPDDLPTGVSRQSGDIEEMRALFKGWDPILLRYLNLVTVVDKWKLQHHNGLDSWIHPDGKFVALGDAVHPMLPYLAQGANSAVEDGVVLGECLRRIKSLADIPKAVADYERIRKPRSDKVISHVNEQRTWNHLPDGPEQQARDKLFAEQTGERRADYPAHWINPQTWDYICGYDAHQAVEDFYASS